MHCPPDGSTCALTLLSDFRPDAKRRDWGASGQFQVNFNVYVNISLPVFDRVGFSTSKMAASMTRVRQVRSLIPQMRQYSSSSTPVKRLGVIGAGQMVSLKACDSLNQVS